MQRAATTTTLASEGAEVSDVTLAACLNIGIPYILHCMCTYIYIYYMGVSSNRAVSPGKLDSKMSGLPLIDI